MYYCRTFFLDGLSFWREIADNNLHALAKSLALGYLRRVKYINHGMFEHVIN
jgi:hypothetical protein